MAAQVQAGCYLSTDLHILDVAATEWHHQLSEWE